MLFRRKIERCCGLCSRGTNLENDQVLCIKRGMVSKHNACIRFSYDPCKRYPLKQKALNFSQFKDDDFKL